jgi:hypothetical protein
VVLKSSLVAEASNESTQPELQFLDHSVWEYAVLVTNADYSTEAMGQLYRVGPIVKMASTN